MDYRFAVLTWLFAVAASAAEVGAQTAPQVSLVPIPAEASPSGISGPELMDLIVHRISEHATVSARVRHSAQMFDRKLVGSGNYLQARQGQRLQVRFSLSAKTADRMVNLLHVCDGRTLWMFDNLDGREKLSRVDLLRLQQAADGQGGALMPLMLGGGLPQLVGSLQQNFIASTPQPVVFQEVPVWAITLRWNPQRLARLLGKADLFDEQGRLHTDRLPEQFPDRVFLLVGQDDLFPYHLDFRRSTSDDVLSSVTINRKSTSRSLTTMELFEVQFNVPLEPMMFNYKPGNIQIDDRTDEYLAQLKAVRKKEAVGDAARPGT